MKITLLVISLLISSLSRTATYESLSCSNKTTGTQIYFINGVNTLEWSSGNETTATTAAERIRQLINLKDNRERIDANGKVFVDYIYNNKEEYYLDFIQTIAQKIEEDGQAPKAAGIAMFLFQRTAYCAANPIICTAVAGATAILMVKQAYISRQDIKQMADFIQQSLVLKYKVIVVTHSQGNLYGNYLYDELLKRGVSTDYLNKYYANLQVASAASSIKAKNHRLYSAKQDIVIGSLRTAFPRTLAGNYSFENWYAPGQD